MSPKAAVLPAQRGGFKRGEGLRINRLKGHAQVAQVVFEVVFVAERPIGVDHVDRIIPHAHIGTGELPRWVYRNPPANDSIIHPRLGVPASKLFSPVSSSFSARTASRSSRVVQLVKAAGFVRRTKAATKSDEFLEYAVRLFVHQWNLTH